MLLIVLAGIILLAFFLVKFTGNFFYNYVIRRSNKSYIKVFSELNNADPNADEKKKVYDWVKNTKIEEQRLTAFDGIELFGQIGRTEQKSHKWVICVHGYACTGNSMYKYAKHFYENGFNFVLPDCRGHGRSGGKYMGMGYHDRLDILQWIDEILNRDADAEILLFGVSMGAATVMMTAGETLPKNVKCLVEDCGYTSAKDTFRSVYKREFPWLVVPYDKLFSICNSICKRRANYDMQEAAPLQQVKKAKVPMLFIHGKEDHFVPYTMVYELYEAANCEKGIMLVEGAGHIKSYEVAKDDYWKQVFDFVNDFV